jgi:hypothetical protein
MVEPVVAQHILLAAMAGAMVVLFGAVYATLFAWSRIKKNPRFMIGAYLAYSVFVAFAAIMAYTLNLTGFWYLIVAVMLIGYLLAPHGIWHLCVGTHKAED